MRTILVATLVLTSGLFYAAIASPQPLRVLIVTGGHDFDEADFLGMFHQMDGITFTHVIYGKGAEQELTPVGTKDFDTIVFYDMHQEKDPQSKGIEDLLAQGKGIVFLHHSLWSYDGTWPEYYQILGGRASSKEKVVPGESPTSTYKHGQHFRVHIADASSPVTKNLRDFEIEDETYNHYWVDPKVHVLLTCDDPTSEHVIGWSHEYKNSRVVYIELGHDRSAYENDSYRTLVRQAISWTANQ